MNVICATSIDLLLRDITKSAFPLHIIVIKMVRVHQTYGWIRWVVTDLKKLSEIISEHRFTFK